ncbi:MAG: ABC transporter ATP-binding protein [bacterium]|nr:ABC transporter ATP-binding protein [bacterium]
MHESDSKHGTDISRSVNSVLGTNCDVPGTDLLDIRGLRTFFHTGEGLIKAVDDVSFGICRGEALGVVGESGSGKSVTALSIMRLIQIPPGEIAGGAAMYRGKDLLKLPESKMRQIRGNEIAMIFQDPMTCLNPLMTVGDQICEAIILHQKLKKRDAWDVGISMLEKVKIPLPVKRMKAYPFEMSGGMRQRVMIAMALSCNPSILIADEPTTALDVTIQAQILELISDLRRDTGMAVWMITHDLGVVAETCSRVVVMYAGMVMEVGTVGQIFHDPLHPYTVGLLSCLPRVDKIRERLTPIAGQPPNMAALPKGCPFVERCVRAMEGCWENRPEEKEVGEGRRVRCWLWE